MSLPVSLCLRLPLWHLLRSALNRSSGPTLELRWVLIGIWCAFVCACVCAGEPVFLWTLLAVGFRQQCVNLRLVSASSHTLTHTLKAFRLLHPSPILASSHIMENWLLSGSFFPSVPLSGASLPLPPSLLAAITWLRCGIRKQTAAS